MTFPKMLHPRYWLPGACIGAIFSMLIAAMLVCGCGGAEPCHVAYCECHAYQDSPGTMTIAGVADCDSPIDLVGRAEDYYCASRDGILAEPDADGAFLPGCDQIVCSCGRESTEGYKGAYEPSNLPSWASVWTGDDGFSGDCWGSEPAVSENCSVYH